MDPAPRGGSMAFAVASPALPSRQENWACRRERRHVDKSRAAARAGGAKLFLFCSKLYAINNLCLDKPQLAVARRNRTRRISVRRAGCGRLAPSPTQTWLPIQTSTQPAGAVGVL